MIEQFETFDDAGNLLGLVDRPEVHARGLWHRSSHVFLFRSDGRLIVQRRAVDKDLYPGRLDYSVGEHLTPGETHEQGAHRGLEEELGITHVVLEAVGPERRARFEDVALGVHDCEIQQAFRGVFDGALEPDPVEVEAVECYRLDELGELTATDPERFTPWFTKDLRELGFVVD